MSKSKSKREHYHIIGKYEIADEKAPFKIHFGSFQQGFSHGRKYEKMLVQEREERANANKLFCNRCGQEFKGVLHHLLFKKCGVWFGFKKGKKSR